MTEHEWMNCELPSEMLDYLCDKACERKLRLFGVACCRWAWNLIAPVQNRRIVETLEERIDEPVGQIDSGLISNGAPTKEPIPIEDILVRGLVQGNAWGAAYSAAFRAPRMGWTLEKDTWTKGYQPVSRIVREIFGNPFRQVTLDPALRTTAIVSLAEDSYAERALPSGELEPGRLAKLADMLENAGCKEKSILEHLREPGSHFRGCWALDAVLGRS